MGGEKLFGRWGWENWFIIWRGKKSRSVLNIKTWTLDGLKT